MNECRQRAVLNSGGNVHVDTLFPYVCVCALIFLNICQAQTSLQPRIEQERQDPGQSFHRILPRGKDDIHIAPGGLIMKKSISFPHTSFLT